MGLFDLFKKKEDKPETAEKTTSKVALSSELAKSYKELYSKCQELNLEEAAKSLIEKDDYSDPMVWMEAFAICDVALEKNELTDTIKELYRQIYSTSWNKHVAMDFNDSDYDFWFNINVALNDRFIAAGHVRGYAEQADLYSSVRRSYQSFEKEVEYYKKGIEKGDATSMGCYGYNIYYGLRQYGQPDKEEGKRLIERSKELGYESADLLLLYLDLYDEKSDKEALLKSILAYNENSKKSRKAHYLLADYYLREGKMPEAIEAMEKGVAESDRNSQYLYGMHILRGQVTDADKTEGIQHLARAYNYHVLHAASFLGQYYSYSNDENSSIEKAIEWHEKASLYGLGDSAFELGVIYSYNDQVKNPEKGMEWLNIGIELGSHKCMAEKAYLLLENENRTPKDLEEAKKLLEQAMEKGNDYAPYRLGQGYERAEFCEEADLAKALELYNLAAERGNVFGMEMAGHYYRLDYVNEDETNAAKGVELFEKAVERNSNYARVELALCYETGHGVEKDLQKAFDLYKQAAENGYPYANLKMAYYLEGGLAGEEDLTGAFENFKIAAEAGIAEAVSNVGRFYRYGVGIPENPQEAIKYFEKAVEMGDVPAMTEMALVYEHEYGGREFDTEKIMKHMTDAAEQGYPYAQYKVGYYHYYGLIEQDIPKGVEWFQKSYEQGYPYAALMLGNYYLYNHGGEKDYAKAFDYYKFAEQSNCINEGLGICYEFGFGVDENNVEAFKYYKLAADDNDTTAKYRLGLCYKYGTGTNEDLAQAYNYFAQAAEDDHYSAQYEVAMALLDGNGVAQNEPRAVELLQKAAEQDNDDAQFELGNCYLTGRGIAEDETQAMVWYQKAADNGNEQAQKLTGKRERKRG